MITEIYYIKHVDVKHSIHEVLDIKSSKEAANKVKRLFIANNPNVSKSKVKIFLEQVITEHPYKIKILFNKNHSINEIHISPNINDCLENIKSIDTSKLNIRLSKDKMSINICLYAEDDITALNKSLTFLNNNLIRLLQ